MTINQILGHLCSGEKLALRDGSRIATVSVSEPFGFRSDERNIRVFVTLASGRQFVVLSGDIQAAGA